MSREEPVLVFVYNADSGLFEAVRDGVRKLVAPMTQTCRLCALTYQVAWMRPEWSRFVHGLGIPIEFLHKDEFKERFPETEASFPSAYIESDGKLSLLISQEEMNSLKNLDDLIEIVLKKLEERVHTSG